MADVIFDVKALIRDLNDIDPDLRKAMIREAKTEAKPMASKIKSVIPTVAPISGLSKTRVSRSGGGFNSNPTGRLAWGEGKPANSVSIRFRSGRSRRTAVTTLVGIWVTSPMTAIADTAGKGSMRKAVTVTREYSYKNGTRRHRVNGQGSSLVKNLKDVGLNNFVYPAVESQIPDTERQVKLVFERYAAMVNRKLN